MGFTTVTGIALEDVPARLQAIFEDEKAYKKVPGGANLTDISTGFMLERVTQVFGLKGFGWNMRYRPEDMELIIRENNNRVIARLRYAEFVYILVDEQGQRHEYVVPTGGANENTINYVEEGARTNALGAALKGLTFQLPVYKNEYDHDDAHRDAVVRERQQASEKVTPAKANGAPAKPAPAKPAAVPAPATATIPAPVAAKQGDATALTAEESALLAAFEDTVPNGIPLAGQKLADAMNNAQFGEWILKFLAKEVQNRNNEWFTPKSVTEEALVEHAKLVLAHMRKSKSN